VRGGNEPQRAGINRRDAENAEKRRGKIIDDEIDGCAEDCAGYEGSFSVWHRISFFCFGVSAAGFFFFHGWIIPCGHEQDKGKVWGHLVPENRGRVPPFIGNRGAEVGVASRGGFTRLPVNIARFEGLTKV
jgi:hypothetical protein